jgi:hypothetical protein
MKSFRLYGIVYAFLIKNSMEHKKRLEELNQRSLEEFENYLQTKSEIKDEHHEKIKQAKDEWQVAWNKFLETLLVLERLEI